MSPKTGISNSRSTGTKPDWYIKSERLLKSMKNLPIEIDNLKLQLELLRITGPSITQKYQQVKVETSHVSSPTEQVVLREERLQEEISRREILLQMLENTIRSFSPEEHLAYQLRYELEKREKEVWDKMQISRTAYFNLQKRVVLKTALLLGIPVPPEEHSKYSSGLLWDD